MPADRLTPEEDAALRRLHWFEQLGCELSNALATLKANFRGRDRRAEIREPGQTYDAAGQQVRTKVKDTDSYWAR